jgi:hypothetical protein
MTHAGVVSEFRLNVWLLTDTLGLVLPARESVEKVRHKLTCPVVQAGSTYKQQHCCPCLVQTNTEVINRRGGGQPCR